MKRFFDSFKEASTWAGVAGVVLSVSPFLPPPFHICAQAMAGIAAALAGAIREGSKA
ncbi:hypothetical protein [Janthinobacterium sp. UMAB-60]|uniref:hypothetical protein n=1 Tax=Janthinobacterium sp. UMAB-60 TaxID=1365365 RepID=UPI001C55C7EB|nr:hypothetical protein [Janthinobacterium sp. UMAB-60]